MFELEGRVAFVSGAGRGVGAAIATVLARQGARVIVNGRNRDRVDAVVKAITDEGASAYAAPCDVTDFAAVHAAMAQAVQHYGQQVDILVNNAGVASDPASHGHFRSLDPQHWHAPIDLNIYGALNCIHAVLDGMCEAQWGRIIQISSGSARTGQNLGVSLYASGKSGIEGFIRHLAAEVGHLGVTANVLALGHQQNLADLMDASAIEKILATIPIGRLGDPFEVAAAVAYLASEPAGGLTGQTIDFNGGSQTR